MGDEGAAAAALGFVMEVLLMGVLLAAIIIICSFIGFIMEVIL